MGCTLEELSERMSAAEFAEHFMLERLEPLLPGHQLSIAAQIAAAANGPLQPPKNTSHWRASDFYSDPWAPPPPPPAPRSQPSTVAEIMATARAGGMV